MSKRIIFGKKQGAKKGRVPNHIYGYNKISTYNLEINKKEEGVVKVIFNMYTRDNMGLRKIAAALNKDYIPSKNGGLWSPKAIQRILTNPIYMGILITNKTETTDFLLSKRRKLPEGEKYHHSRPELAIVGEDVFAEAQKILKSRNNSQRREEKLC